MQVPDNVRVEAFQKVFGEAIGILCAKLGKLAVRGVL